eukprot:scaffold1307_cov166-Ochromonas_danica.AAC.45
MAWMISKSNATAYSKWRDFPFTSCYPGALSIISPTSSSILQSTMSHNLPHAGGGSELMLVADSSYYSDSFSIMRF